MDCKQDLLSNVSPSSISSSFASNVSLYGGPNTVQSLYSSGLVSDPSGLLINGVPCSIIKEEREDYVDSSCHLRNSGSNMVITNSSNTTLNSNALGSINLQNSSPNTLNTRLPSNQPEEGWSSSSSPGKMSVETPINGNNPIFGPNGFSPMSTGSYDTYSPNGREDMSPPSSINGNTMDSFRESRRNRGPTSRQQEELCLVCGDRASGYHYNALTCEGCKGFFRRSITKNAVYQCKYGNNCEIDMYMRRKCQECRLKKCLKVGMRPECVVPEYQCAVKREAKRAQKDKDKPNSTTKDRPQSPDHIRTSTTTTTTTTSSTSNIAISPDNSSKPNNVDDGASDMELTMEEEELIERLVFFQEEFESPSPEDMAKITNSHPSDDDGENRYKHITEITIYTIRLIVEFAKRVPWFDTLMREDQITLLKACSSEVMMLRTARRYDINTDTIVFANDQPYTRENYNSAGLGDCTNAIFHFCRQMCLYKVDNAEYALLTAVVLFSDRPHLVELKKVEQVQEIYLEALRKYELKNRQRGHLRFARLLSVLTELRSLGSLNSEMCFSLKLKNKELPPFLAEIWDINS